MLLNTKSIIFVLAFTFLFAGCQESAFQSLKKTEDIFVYEGLPHPVRENPYFDKEKQRNDVIQVLGHWFYDKKVKASMTKGEKKPQKLHADSGSKLTKVETEPKVDYKN